MKPRPGFLDASTPKGRPTGPQAAAIKVWNVHYNYARCHSAVGDQPPASRLHAGVTNVVNQNT